MDPCSTLRERMLRLKKLGGVVNEMEMRSDSHSELLPCTTGSYWYPSLSVNHCVTCTRTTLRFSSRSL